MANCYKCKKVPVEEEFTRCPDCHKEHLELCAKLNANHKVWEKPPKEVLIPFKSIKQGIVVTTYMTREEAEIWGLKIPKEYA